MTYIEMLNAENARLMKLVIELRAEAVRLNAQTVPVGVARIVECAQRLVDGADFKLGGCIGPKSKPKEIPSNAVSSVKARHLAALKAALSAAPAAPAAPQPAQQLLTEKDALLRQALEALEPFELRTSLAERTAEAIRNHLGVKND